jgi:thioredoxin reductase
MTQTTDVAVVGGGPAGLNAAIEAARLGASVVVIDENPQLGGQIYRQLPRAFTVLKSRDLGADSVVGQELLEQVGRLPISVMTGATVWGCFEPRMLEVAQGTRSFRIEARAVVIATGAYDRPVPLPGWTLPGVMTVGAAQTLLKSQRILPRGRIVFAGTGPLLLVVAAQLAKAGAKITAVVDTVPPLRALRHLPALLGAWPLTRKGLDCHLTLRRARVPWFAPAILVAIDGDQDVRRCTIARATEDWTPVPGTERSLDADTVCLGYGLVPSIELLSACECALRYDERADVWLPERSEDCETSVPGVFAVGDGAGVAGVLVASEEGRIAGIAAARRAGRPDDAETSSRRRTARKGLARIQAFRATMDAIYRPGPGLYSLATPSTTICRCEEVRACDIADALNAGADSLSQVKAWTRAGMGLCQARMCGAATTHLVATHLGVTPGRLDPYTPRPPAKATSVAAIVGATD